jgi:hypothetical protein
MDTEQKTTFIFNRILIDFFKEIKKDNYFKLVIKKHYKVIDKKSPKYIKLFIKKTTDYEFGKLFLDPDFNVNNLKAYEDLLDVSILKNVKINKLLRTFNDDKENIMSYLLILYLLSYLYTSFSDQVQEFHKNNSTDKETCLDDDDEVVEDEVVVEDDDDVEDDGDVEDDVEDEVVEDDETTLDDLYTEQQKFLFTIVEILEKINKKEDINNELSEILDDDIKSLLININKVKVFINLDGNIEDLIGNSKIGNLAKEISESINLEGLNIENPSDLLNPSNLFGGEGGNILGNLVQQVGSSITDKINSGELKQDELVKDAFSLMNKMQNGSSNNPIINDMMNNMMNCKNENSDNSNKNTNQSSGGGGMPDIAEMMKGMMNPDMMKGMMNPDMMKGMMNPDMMKGMMNPDMMQQMMNNMGGSQGLHQNNPESRENKMREKLKSKLQDKNK